MDYFQKGRLSLSNEVYNDILAKILNNEWEEGEKLPSETQLCKLYGVSRVSVRAALQKLQGLGFIVTAQGVGSFVHKAGLESERRDRQPPMLTGDGYKKFFEFRQAIEFKALELFIQHMTEEDRAYLRSLIEKMRECAAAENWELFPDYDVEFHMAVIRGSRNPFLFEVMKEYQGEFRQYLLAMSKQTLKPLTIIAEEHQDIYDLIAAKKIKGVQKYLYDNNMYYQQAYFSK